MRPKAHHPPDATSTMSGQSLVTRHKAAFRACPLTVGESRICSISFSVERTITPPPKAHRAKFASQHDLA